MVGITDDREKFLQCLAAKDFYGAFITDHVYAIFSGVLAVDSVQTRAVGKYLVQSFIDAFDLRIFGPMRNHAEIVAALVKLHDYGVSQEWTKLPCSAAFKVSKPSSSAQPDRPMLYTAVGVDQVCDDKVVCTTDNSVPDDVDSVTTSCVMYDAVVGDTATVESTVPLLAVPATDLIAVDEVGDSVVSTIANDGVRVDTSVVDDGGFADVSVGATVTDQAPCFILGDDIFHASVPSHYSVYVSRVVECDDDDSLSHVLRLYGYDVRTMFEHGYCWLHFFDRKYWRELVCDYKYPSVLSSLQLRSLRYLVQFGGPPLKNDFVSVRVVGMHDSEALYHVRPFSYEHDHAYKVVSIREFVSFGDNAFAMCKWCADTEQSCECGYVLDLFPQVAAKYTHKLEYNSKKFAKMRFEYDGVDASYLMRNFAMSLHVVNSRLPMPQYDFEDTEAYDEASRVTNRTIWQHMLSNYV